MHIVYVPDSFPQPSETFVINEIDGLLNQGFQVSVVPRIVGDVTNTQHARLQVILPMISVIYDKIHFDIRAFFLAHIPGLRVNEHLAYSHFEQMYIAFDTVDDCMRFLK